MCSSINYEISLVENYYIQSTSTLDNLITISPNMKPDFSILKNTTYFLPLNVIYRLLTTRYIAFTRKNDLNK